MRAVFSFVAVIALCGSAHGQFGITADTRLWEFRTTPISIGVFEISDVPVPNPLFEKYFAFAAPNAGICQLIAHTEDFENVEETRDRFTYLVGLMDRRYPLNEADLELRRLWREIGDNFDNWTYKTEAGVEVDLVIWPLRLNVSIAYRFQPASVCEDELDQILQMGLPEHPMRGL